MTRLYLHGRQTVALSTMIFDKYAFRVMMAQAALIGVDMSHEHKASLSLV